MKHVVAGGQAAMGILAGTLTPIIPLIGMMAFRVPLQVRWTPCWLVSVGNFINRAPQGRAQQIVAGGYGVVIVGTMAASRMTRDQHSHDLDAQTKKELDSQTKKP
jgi:hypothetical protein